MMLNSLPCKDILWAYMRREGTDKTGEKQLIINYHGNHNQTSEAL